VTAESPPLTVLPADGGGESGDWPKAVRLNLKATNYDAHKTLNRVWGIKGQLRDSIKTLTERRAPSTIKRKGI